MTIQTYKLRINTAKIHPPEISKPNNTAFIGKLVNNFFFTVRCLNTPPTNEKKTLCTLSSSKFHNVLKFLYQNTIYLIGVSI